MTTTSTPPEGSTDILRKLWAHEIGCATADVKDGSDFFELGGDSVAAMRLVASARDAQLQLRVQDVYNHPKYSDMAEQAKPLKDASQPTATETQEAEQASLLSAENLKWTWGVMHTFESQTCLKVDQIEDVYRTGYTQVLTMPMLFQCIFKIVKGTPQQIKEAIRLVQNKVPILRVRCVEYDGGYYHFVTTPEVPIHEENSSSEEYQMADQGKIPKMGDPLTRFAIIRDGSNIYLHWTLSHGITDRPTRSMLVEELRSALEDPKTYAQKPPALLPRAYTAYIEDIQEEAMKYWSKALDGGPTVQPLTAIRDPAFRPTMQKLKRMPHLTSPHKSILFSTITQAAWMFCLARKNKSDDVIITTARSGRAIPLQDIDQMKGCCAAVAPTRGRLVSKETLLDFFQELQQSIVDGLAYEAWGGAALKAHLSRTPSHIFSHSPPDHATIAGRRIEARCAEEVILDLFIPPRRNPWATYMEVAPGVDGGSLVKSISDETCYDPIELDALIEEFIVMVDAIVTGYYEKSWEKVTVGEVLPHLYDLEDYGQKPSTLLHLLPKCGTSSAVILPTSNSTISQANLEGHVDHLQSCFARMGVSKGESVAMALPNGYELLTAFLATTRQRGIAAPLNPNYKESEFDFYLDDLRPKLLLIPHSAHESSGDAVRSARKHNIAIAEIDFKSQEIILDLKEGSATQPAARTEPEKDDIALILHTSGTTGRPKAVPLTHQNLLSSTDNLISTYNLTRKDRTILIMPLFHIHGLVASFLSPLRSGGSIILPPRLSPDFWNTFASWGGTWYSATPTMHSLILGYDKAERMPRIRFIRSCSSPLSPAMFEKLEQAFGAPVLESYAMTEASHIMTSSPLPPARRTPGSVGKVQGSVELRILDDEGKEVEMGREGEVGIRGPNVTTGYLHNEEANAKSFTNEGFFRTGDQGKVDSEGYLTLTGRLKEFVNKGGEKISPVELDNIISQHESVGEVVCFAMEDEVYGQDVGCAVRQSEGKSGAKELDVGELKKWIRDRVASHKVPKKIWIVEQIPKTATGKVQRRMVAEKMAELGG